MVNGSGVKLPVCEDSQEWVIGAILRENNIVADVVALLQPKHFTGDHRVVFEILIRLYANGGIDAVDINDELQKRCTNEQRRRCTDLLHRINQDVFTSVGWQKEAQRILRAELQRALYDVGMKLVDASQRASAEPVEAIEEAERLLSEVTTSGRTRPIRMVGELYGELLHRIADRRQGKHDRTIPTGLYDLDEMIGGLRPGMLTTLAARPSMGKTALALTILSNIAEQGFSCLLFSLEMADLELIERFASGRSRINSIRIRNGKVDDNELDVLVDNFDTVDKQLFGIADQSVSTVQQIKSYCRQFQLRHGLDLVAIDYIGLITPSDGKRPKVEQVSEISRSLKLLAGQFKVPVLLLSQLNRESEKRPDKKPYMSDLRDSGSLEQDSDSVWLLHRPYYYGIEGAGPREAELIVAKQRNGPTGSVDLCWFEEYTRFENAKIQWETEPVSF